MTADYEYLRPRPKNWARVPTTSVLESLPDAIVYGAFIRSEPRHPLRAMVTIDLGDRYERGAGHWLHVSLSRANRLPTWADLCKARDELGYGDRVFVQVMPPGSAWLNVHEYCLHLISRVDGETIPRVMWDQVGATGEHYGKRAPM